MAREASQAAPRASRFWAKSCSRGRFGVSQARGQGRAMITQPPIEVRLGSQITFSIRVPA